MSFVAGQVERRALIRHGDVYPLMKAELLRTAERSSRVVREPESHGTRPTPGLVTYRALGNQACGRYLQAALEIGRADDRYEQEADQIAEQVLRMPQPDPGARVYVERNNDLGASEHAFETTAGTRLPAHESTPVIRQSETSNHRFAMIQRKEEDTEKESSVPSKGALKAVDHAEKMLTQNSPAIWFDSWGNDLRDNDLNGKIDVGKERGLNDGSHYNKSYKAKICKDPGQTTDTCPAKDQSNIDVSYKVCIDIPIEAYRAAGVSIPTSRWIPTFFGELSKKPDWTVWKKPARPAKLLAGDIVAAANAKHQHAGIMVSGLLFDNVINLPGPTASRKFGYFKPSGTNDLLSVARVLFEAYLQIDWVARPKK